VTVWAGDLGGFTRLDTIEAKFNNLSGHGLCSGIECAASEAEPGVLHLLWGEGGQFYVDTTTHDQWIGQRTVYSRWDFTSKTLETDLLYADEAGTGLNGFNSDGNWAWTGEMILRNDHGAPIAILWPWVTNNGPVYLDNPQFIDLSGGSANILQTGDPALTPTPEETGVLLPELFGKGIIQSDGFLVSTYGTDATYRRCQYASSLYVDPSLSNRSVYLICAGYDGDSVRGPDAAAAVSFLRIPCDGSDTFDYMDGTRLYGYSVMQNNMFGTGDFPTFQSDFVSDEFNVWMPGNFFVTGGAIYHLPRICSRTWEVDPAFPTDPLTGYESGKWGNIGSSPIVLIYDSAGDWLSAGGYGPTFRHIVGDTWQLGVLRAKICRCCVPCLERVGLHVWEKV
jgi:hypothetical protein